MRRFILLSMSVFLIALFLSAFAFAGKPERVNAKSAVAVKIPAHAVQVAPNVFSLGTSVDNGRVVEGFIIVHRKEGYGKPGTSCGNGVCEAGENARKCPADCGGGTAPSSSCFGFLAKGAKWKVLEPYVVNPTNSRGLDEGFVASNFAADISKWEAAAGTEILGPGATTGVSLVADTISTDGLNEVYFGDIQEPGAIAVTIVWGIFRGPPKQRQLVEWDQVYDEVDYDWSSSGESNKMDFENIATHELGHSVGLDDLYEATCAEETMYGYANFGETKKGTLEAGDIAGVSDLY